VAQATATHGVMLVPARSAAGDTVPPTPWWQLALKRFWVQLVVVLPFIIDALINLYQHGQVEVPSKWAGLISVLVILYQTAAKALKEQGNQQATAQLQAQGVPVGTVIHPAVAREALGPLASQPASP
jgi:hypothetical protein